MIHSGVNIRVEQPGTIFRDERTGQAHTITDQNAVMAGGTMFVTPRVLDAIRAQVPDDRRCMRCGETAPEPHELCLTRGVHEPGAPCPYSREGQARTAAILEDVA